MKAAVVSNKNTTNENWPEIQANVTTWDEFNLANLNESYGHILDVSVPVDQLHPAPRRPEQAFRDVAMTGPHSVKHLIAWNDEITEPTLGFAKTRLGVCPGVVMRHSFSDAARARLVKTHGIAVDHLIELDD